jgi:hypothetical protein
VRVASGPVRRVAEVQRLRGGSKKGVYRLWLDNGRTVIGYVWAEAENYWPAPRGPDADAGPFGQASGAGLFEAAGARLAAVGVRTPRVYLLDRTLDADRLRLYRLAMHLSLIAGPLRLLDGGFPDRDPMLRIVDYDTEKALASVR